MQNSWLKDFETTSRKKLASRRLAVTSVGRETESAWRLQFSRGVPMSGNGHGL
tara:strand:- start:209 stop:367 length:159 start_codon:yes stop_codon:yes gene_type:complete